MDKLRGPKGTKVTITIAREGLEKPLELTITREEIPLYSVPYAFMLKDERVGYIFIRNFAETTAEEFEQKMEALSRQGMKSLILDLRGNPGGALIPAIEVADEFLPKGALIVSVKGRNRIYDRDFRRQRTASTRSCRSSSSSTRAAPAPRRSSPARSWTTTAA